MQLLINTIILLVRIVSIVSIRSIMSSTLISGNEKSEGFFSKERAKFAGKIDGAGNAEQIARIGRLTHPGERFGRIIERRVVAVVD